MDSTTLRLSPLAGADVIWLLNLELSLKFMGIYI